MNGKQVGATAIVSFACVLIVAIVVSGAVLGEPTLLITGAERLRQAENRATAAERNEHAAETKLWHIEHPGRDY